MNEIFDDFTLKMLICSFGAFTAYLRMDYPDNGWIANGIKYLFLVLAVGFLLVGLGSIVSGVFGWR